MGLGIPKNKAQPRHVQPKSTRDFDQDVPQMGRFLHSDQSHGTIYLWILLEKHGLIEPIKLNVSSKFPLSKSPHSRLMCSFCLESLTHLLVIRSRRICQIDLMKKIQSNKCTAWSLRVTGAVGLLCVVHIIAFVVGGWIWKDVLNKRCL